MSEHDFKEMISKMSKAGIKKNIQHQINMDVELYASKIRREIKKFKHFNKNLIKKKYERYIRNV